MAEEYVCRQYRTFEKKDTPLDEVAEKIRQRYDDKVSILTIFRVDSPYKDYTWYEYVICWEV